MHVSRVNHERPSYPEADPARHDASEARPAICTCCGGTREPDPTDENLRLLRRAANLSMGMMELASERAHRAVAAEAAPAQDAADRADLAFHRSGRSLRFCITLSDKLHAGRLERDKKLAAGDAVEVKERKTRLKSQAKRLVMEAIDQQVEKEIQEEIERRAETERLTESERETESEDTEAFDEDDEDEDEDDEIDFALHHRACRGATLRSALFRRLEEEDIERDLGRCPQSELVGRLCGDLKIQTPWERWDTEHWAKEEARLKVPGSPYPRPPAAEPEPAEAPEAKPKPEAARPEPAAAKPEEVGPPEPEPEVPKPPEPAAEEAKPEAPAVPPKRNIDWYRTPEHQRELEEHKARIRAILSSRL